MCKVELVVWRNAMETVRREVGHPDHGDSEDDKKEDC